MEKQRMTGEKASGGGIQHFWMRKGSPTLPRLTRAEGIYLYDEDGNSYIDVTSGPVVVNVGHSNPRVLEAMQAQAANATYTYPAYMESEANILFGDKLTQLSGSGLDRAFFVSGGSEAVETAIKFARVWAVATKQKQRTKIISRNPSYHGSTLGALGISADSLNELMAPMMKSSIKIPAPFSYRQPEGFDPDSYARYCAEALEKEILNQGADSVLAFVIEPIMGLSGGATFATDEYYKAIRDICDRYGVLLVYDEIMSGAGRTGKFLAAQHWHNARPDIVTLAKGLGGGYVPLGAMLVPDKMLANVVDAGGYHFGHTAKANPLACAVGLAVLREIEDQELMDNAEHMGAYLRKELEGLQNEIPVIGDVRGKGLLNGIELVSDADSKSMFSPDQDVCGQIKKIALKHGLMIYARQASNGEFGEWLMITPPLIVTRAEIDNIVEGLAATLTEFQRNLKS